LSSEFEELEAVPNLAVMERPLEPPTSSTASVPDVHVPDDSFVNFFSVSTLVKISIEKLVSFMVHCRQFG